MRLKGNNGGPQQGAFSVLQSGVWTAKAIVPWRIDAFSAREGRSFPPPIGLWLLEGEAGGVKVEPSDGKASKARPAGGRASASR